MIDLHSHILPGLDDGAESLDDSLAMIRELAGAGFRTILATPHVLESKHMLDAHDILAAAGRLQAEVARAGIDAEILPGAENYIFPGLPELLADGQLLTLGNQGKYLLVELPGLEIPAYTEEVFFQIQLQGVTPVLAHPERYPRLRAEPELLVQWVNKGVRCQLSLRSLIGKYGRQVQETAAGLLKSNLIHCIGSDAHYPSSRSEPYRAELDFLHNVVGKDQYIKITEFNPKAMLAGEIFAVEPPESPPLTHKSLWDRIRGRRNGKFI